MPRAADKTAPAEQAARIFRDDVKFLLARVVRHLRTQGPHFVLAHQVIKFMASRGMVFSPLRAGEEELPSELVPAHQSERALLRELVDRVWGRAMDDDSSVPSTSVADEIIDQWVGAEILDQWMAGGRAGTTHEAPPEDAANALDPAELGDVIAGMLRSMERESAEFGAELARQPGFAPALEAARKHQLSHFHLQLLHPQEKVCQAVLVAAGIPPKARWLFQNYQFAKLHVQRIIEMREGSQCCVDKTRTILSAWLRFELTGVPIAFDYAGEYTFHLPTTVLSTHEEIVSFCEGLRRLHSGRPDQYLKSLRLLLSPAAVAFSTGK